MALKLGRSTFAAPSTRMFDPSMASPGTMLDPFMGAPGAMLDPFMSAPGTMLDPFDNVSPFNRVGPALTAFNFPALPREVSTVANARVDWVETPEAHLIKADLPGLRKEDIKIQVTDDNLLSISGERSKEEVSETDWFRHVERSYGTFYRQFRLPDDSRPDEVVAKMEHGVLTVTVPKEGREMPQVRDVEIME